MSVRLSVLAILDQGACYGNQLRAEFERRTAGTWPINIGQIYTTLERLERDGLATRLPATDTGHVPYAITDAGRREAREWLAAPVDRSVVTRDEFVVKLALAMTLPEADPSALIAAQRATLAEASRHENYPATGPTERLIRESVRLQVAAELAWLDHCEGLLGERNPFGLAGESPRRGRPARAS